MTQLYEEPVWQYQTPLARRRWLVVLAALGFSLLTVLMLPFSEMLAPSPRGEPVTIRSIETVYRRPAPRPPFRMPTAPRPAKTAPAATKQPALQVPPLQVRSAESRPAEELLLPVSFDFPTPVLATDLDLDVDVQPGPEPQAATAVHENAVDADIAAEPEYREPQGLAELDRVPSQRLRVPPLYPLSAKMRGIEGFVDVQFIITDNGEVRDVTVVHAKPEKIFDEAAAEAVRQWRFTPGIRDGTPVAVRTRVRIRFQLQD